MLSYLVLFLAALSRLFPHALHSTGLNITAVGGGLLFFGSRRSRWQALTAAAVMALTDVYLTCFVYRFPFHVGSYLITWCWYAGICLLGSGLLQKVTFLRTAVAIISSATGFFLLSNFGVWLQGGMYPHSGAGLVACLGAGLPFYGNDLVSTALTAVVLFGLPVAAAHLVRLLQGASEQTPAA